MDHGKRTGVQFSTRYCAMLDREVRVVLVQQPDGTWQVTRCLDKDRVCFGRGHCPLVTRESWAMDTLLMG